MNVDFKPEMVFLDAEFPPSLLDFLIKNPKICRNYLCTHLDKYLTMSQSFTECQLGTEDCCLFLISIPRTLFLFGLGFVCEN